MEFSYRVSFNDRLFAEHKYKVLFLCGVTTILRRNMWERIGYVETLKEATDLMAQHAELQYAIDGKSTYTATVGKNGKAKVVLD